MLITGGAGFIGSNFIRHILKSDTIVDVINIDKLTYASSLDYINNITDDSRHTFIKGDICDYQLIYEILEKHEIDTIVHFAAESHVDRSIVGPAEFIQTNVVGTFTLLEAARKFWLEKIKIGDNECRFHHISTDEVYGTLAVDEDPFDEARPYAPNSPYSASKASSDHLVRSYYHTYGLPVTTTNCSNNFGPFQHTEKFVPTIIRKCYENNNIPVYGDGSNMRDWLYVEDHCIGIDVVIREGVLGETYNIGGDNEWENIGLVKYICKLMDEISVETSPHDRLISFVTDRKGHDFRYAINTEKIKQKLGWETKTNFSDAMRKTVEWFITN